MNNLIAFCNEVISLVVEVQAVDIVYFDFSKAFDAVFS